MYLSFISLGRPQTMMASLVAVRSNAVKLGFAAIAATVIALGAPCVRAASTGPTTSANSPAQLTPSSVQSAKVASPELGSLRLVPLELIGLELGGSVANSALDTVVGRTQGFLLQAQPSGALKFEARGEPFQSVLGRETTMLDFDATVQAWRIRTETGSVQVQLNASFKDPQSQQAIPWSGVTLCRAATQRCSIFFLASAEQVCRLLDSGNFKSEPARRQQALQALNAINAQGVACAAS